MPAIIGAIFFAVLFLLIIVQQGELSSAISSHHSKITYIESSASQMAQFYAASLSFLSGFGTAANGQYITVSDLKKAGLLPGAFPDRTPFGFQLQGWPVADPNNPSITNLTIISVAPNTNDVSDLANVAHALAVTGFGQYSPTDIPVGDIQEINDQIESQLTPTLLTQYAGALNSSKAQSVTIGYTVNNNGNLGIQTSSNSVLIQNTGISASQLPSYESSSPAIEVIAPNQLGYTVVSYSGYFDSTPWEDLQGTSLSGNQLVTAGLSSYPNTTPVYISLSNLGWSPSCPASAQLVTASSNSFLVNEDVLNTNGDNPATGLICFKTYRSEKVNAQYVYWASVDNETTDFVNNSNYSINYGPTGSNYIAQFTYLNGDSNLGIYGNAYNYSYTSAQGSTSTNLTDLPYVNPNMIGQETWTANAIMNGQTYGTPWPQNNFWGGTIPTLFSNVGVDFTVLQPQGQTGTQVNTYQIFFGAYQLPTGVGVSWHDLGLPNPMTSQTGSTGLNPWNSNLTLWRAFCMGSVSNDGRSCYPDAFDSASRLQNLYNLSNRSMITGLNTSTVTAGWYFQVVPEDNTGTNPTAQTAGGAINDLPYGYALNQNGQIQNYTTTFNATIPSSAMCYENYTNGQSGNCPGYYVN